MEIDGKIESFNRIAAVALLSGYTIGLETVWGRIFAVVAICSIAVSLSFIVYLIAKKKLSGTILRGRQDPVFWPGIVLLWTVIAYSKGSAIKLNIILLCVVVVLQLGVLFGHTILPKAADIIYSSSL